MHSFRATAYVQLKNFPDLRYKNDFDIFDPVTISNFPKKNLHKTFFDFDIDHIKREPLSLSENVAGNHNMCVRS